MNAIEFSQVCRHFGSGKHLVKAVDEVSFSVEDGEFFTMLGPSGSGKTTCLRMIAGFDLPTSGIVRVFGDDVTNLPPYERSVNTVFQDYALFPHLSIADNIAYGLVIQKVPKAEREKRVQEMLEMVQLPNVGNRKPSQLSGGQRQRIALARALVNKPRILLLDEPLGALDLKLRQQMQIELKDIQREVGITFLFVTHDQEEALTLSDRIAVFNHGKIEQIGSPQDLYEKPQTAFVANFVGTSNLVEGDSAERITGQRGSFSLRPEKIHLATPDAPTAADHSSIRGNIELVVYLGIYTRYTVRTETGDALLVVDQNRNMATLPIGEPVQLTWAKSSINPIYS